MIDPKILRSDLDSVKDTLKARCYDFDFEHYSALEQSRKKLQIATEELQNERNKLSNQFGDYRRQGKDIAVLKQDIDSVKVKLEGIKQQFSAVKQQLDCLLLEIPNMLDDSVPVGETEADNREVKRIGDIRNFDFTVLDHIAIGEKMGLDLEVAAKLSGSRFMTLLGPLAKLHRSLIQFMLDTHTARGYIETYVPYIVNSESLQGTGQLPKFAEDVFKIEGEHNKYLIPTAEVPMTNIHRDTIVGAEDLPIKYVAHTPCFRSEAGSYGKDVQGLIRQHQFEKVELVQLVAPSFSDSALEQLVTDAEHILELLQLPYRTVVLCSADTGFSAAKTYDLEVWLPAQKCYREISSCSNCKDFQARRMQARYRNSDARVQLLHTLNGSGLAVGRTLVAILENYQQADGSLLIPKALVPYFGSEVITL